MQAPRFQVCPYCNPFPSSPSFSHPHFLIGSCHLSSTGLQNQTIIVGFPTCKPCVFRGDNLNYPTPPTPMFWPLRFPRKRAKKSTQRAFISAEVLGTMSKNNSIGITFRIRSIWGIYSLTLYPLLLLFIS